MVETSRPEWKIKITDDRADKKAEELLPCPGCRDSVYGILHEHTCPSGYRLAIAAELREAYGDYDNLSKKSAHWYKSWEESQQEIEKLKSVFENLEQFLDFVLVVYDAREKELDKAYAEIARLRAQLAVAEQQAKNAEHLCDKLTETAMKQEIEIDSSKQDALNWVLKQINGQCQNQSNLTDAIRTELAKVKP